MFSKKDRIIIALTCTNPEFLRICLPSICKLKSPIYLIIHNDNPDNKIYFWQIRAFGYFGPIRIINNYKNSGELQSRINILSEIKKLKIKSDWMVFVDQDDIITNIDISVVNANNFAIIQNKAIIKHRLIDLLKVMKDNNNYKIDDENIVVEKPNLNITGTLLRTDLMIQFGELLGQIIPSLNQIENGLDYRIPYKPIMWNWLQMYAKFINPMATPIYMDKVNYIATDLDTANKKYGKNIINDKNYEKTLNLYNNVFQDVLKIKENEQ